MATLNEIAYDLLTMVRPKLSDDSDLEISQIKFWIKNYRELLIRNELLKGTKSIDSELLQTVCDEVELVDASVCCGVELKCHKILRTKRKVPQLIGLGNKDSLVKVGPIRLTGRGFSIIDYLAAPWAGNGKFNANLIFAFIHDEYVYVMTEDPKYRTMKKISYRGLFSDPVLLAEFNACSEDADCYNDDMPYPIKGWMIPEIGKLLLKNLSLLSQSEIQSVDKSNNAQSDIGDK